MIWDYLLLILYECSSNNLRVGDWYTVDTLLRTICVYNFEKITKCQILKHDILEKNMVSEQTSFRI